MQLSRLRANKRICKLCHNALENALHFILKCPSYDGKRITKIKFDPNIFFFTMNDEKQILANDESGYASHWDPPAAQPLYRTILNKTRTDI